jgi:hypothetical protein
MSENSFPARIHVLVPTQSENALVLRRGPSKHTGVFSWNTRTDEIKLGQWLKGRIYERRSDISPDGKHWIYFAMNGHWGSESKGSWTAIARAPFLKAVEFFPKGDCWHGGGLFLGKRYYWLNDGYGHERGSSSNGLNRIDAVDWLQNYGGECPGVYYNRLQRDGWTLTGRGSNGRYDEWSIFEKSTSANWTLRKICHEQIGAPKGRGCYWDEHVLVSGETLELTSWEWADVIGRSIVFAKNGCLYRLTDLEGKRRETLIHDFNEYVFENAVAPY